MYVGHFKYANFTELTSESEGVVIVLPEPGYKFFRLIALVYSVLHSTENGTTDMLLWTTFNNVFPSGSNFIVD